MAEAAFDDMLGAELEQKHFINTLFSRYNKREKIWETRDGRKLSIQEMTDSHLQNSYKMILRSKYSDYKNVTLRILKTEISRRKNEYYKTAKYCPNCNSTKYENSCKDCGFDATENDTY